MGSIESIAQTITNTAVLVILAVIAVAYGIRMIREQLGFVPRSSESKIVESLGKSLETSVEALRDTVQGINNIVGKIEDLSRVLRTWQQPVVERLERIEQLIQGEGESKR